MPSVKRCAQRCSSERHRRLNVAIQHALSPERSSPLVVRLVQPALRLNPTDGGDYALAANVSFGGLQRGILKVG